jgi:hypothetical protein
LLSELPHPLGFIKVAKVLIQFWASLLEDFLLELLGNLLGRGSFFAEHVILFLLLEGAAFHTEGFNFIVHHVFSFQ